MVADGCVADSIDVNGSHIATTILPDKPLDAMKNECDNRNRTSTEKTNTARTFTCSPNVSRHCRVSCALCWSWFSRCHWSRTSRRSARKFKTSTSFHHAYTIPNTKLFSSGCCSPTLSCHRQLKLYTKFLHVSHRENGSFEVVSLHPPSVTIDRRQL